MSKLEKNMDFCPPRKWLAIRKDSSSTMEVNVLDMDYGKVVGNATFKDQSGSTTNVVVTWDISNCHICGFTGYCTSKLGTSGDSKGEEVYGGNLMARHNSATDVTRYWLIYWNKGRQEWRMMNLHDNKIDFQLWDMMREDGLAKTIIGHIHQPDQWPEEVRRLLE